MNISPKNTWDVANVVGDSTAEPQCSFDQKESAIETKTRCIHDTWGQHS